MGFSLLLGSVRAYWGALSSAPTDGATDATLGRSLSCVGFSSKVFANVVSRRTIRKIFGKILFFKNKSCKTSLFINVIGGGQTPLMKLIEARRCFSANLESF